MASGMNHAGSATTGQAVFGPVRTVCTRAPPSMRYSVGTASPLASSAHGASKVPRYSSPRLTRMLPSSSCSVTASAGRSSGKRYSVGASASRSVISVRTPSWLGWTARSKSSSASAYTTVPLAPAAAGAAASARAMRVIRASSGARTRLTASTGVTGHALLRQSWTG